MNRWKALLILLLLVMVTACSEPEVAYETYQSEAGVTFDYPQSWVIAEDNMGEINFASSAELLNASTVTDGAGGSVFVSTSEFFGDDALSTLADLVNFMLQGEDDLQVKEEAREVTVNGQAGARVVLTGTEEETDITLSATLIHNETSLAFVILIYDDGVSGEMGSIMTHIEESVQLIDPAQ